MLQVDFLQKVLKECKKCGIHTAVDTAGNVPWEYFEKIISYTDMFLYDVKCASEDLHIEGTGVSNKKIIENLKKLSSVFDGEILIRIPVITGYNDNEEEMKKMQNFLKDINIANIELLPYHKMGERKYDALGMKCITYAPPSQEKMKKYKKFFNQKG